MGLGVLQDHVMEHVPGLVARDFLGYAVVDLQQGPHGILTILTGLR
jgi:hypothetical protein